MTLCLPIYKICIQVMNQKIVLPSKYHSEIEATEHLRDWLKGWGYAEGYKEDMFHISKVGEEVVSICGYADYWM